MAEVRRLGAYLRALRAFLREPLSEEAALEGIRAGLARREDAFLHLVDAAVFGNPRSAYRPLLAHAGVERGDVARLVGELGLEPALERLHDAGVRVTVDELRGRVPLVRDGVELDARGLGFGNPLASVHYEGRTGGSRGPGAPVAVDLARRTAHAAYHAALLRAFGLGRRPTALWYPAPPGVAGLGSVLSHAKLGHPIERWFSQTDWRRHSPKHTLFTAATLAAGRAYGHRLPRPETTPPEAAVRVARWLGGHDGAVLITTPSSAVRVCAAAREHGVDVAGSFFRLSGEPFTEARAEAVADSGCGAAPNYYVAEAGGAVGMACAAASVPDEVHVTTDRLALLNSETLVLTGLDPLAPNVLVNLDTGDSGVLEGRECGCLFQQLGLRRHLHTIRARDKLTSDGMTFLDTEVVELLERVLPERFGGGPADYQLVEYHEGPVSRVALVVAPRVGAVDEAQLVEAALAFLRERGRPQAMMTQVWTQAGTLRVERREPYVTPGAKTPSVHVVRPR